MKDSGVNKQNQGPVAYSGGIKIQVKSCSWQLCFGEGIARHQKRRMQTDAKGKTVYIYYSQTKWVVHLEKSISEKTKGGAILEEYAYKASAAAKIPAAPPTKTMAPVGRGAAVTEAARAMRTAVVTLEKRIFVFGFFD